VVDGLSIEEWAFHPPRIRQTTFFNISFKRPATETTSDMPTSAAAVKQSTGEIKALGVNDIGNPGL
jgi:hypothetical protein